MATQYSFGKIVTDGLVLCLDAADRNSYVSGSTTWFDVASSNNGTLVNGPTFNTGSGGSIVFDGVDDQVYTTSGDVFNIQGPGNITAVLKVNNTGSKASTSILNILKPNNGIQIGYRDYGVSFGIFKYGGGFMLPITDSTNIPQQNEITFISVNFSGSNIEYYKNGTLRQSTSVAVNQTGLAPYVISGYTIAQYAETFTGNIYATQIYNRTLSAQEVLQNYNAQKSRFGL